MIGFSAEDCKDGGVRQRFFSDARDYTDSRCAFQKDAGQSCIATICSYLSCPFFRCMGMSQDHARQSEFDSFTQIAGDL